jgi:hypothetical protein
MIVAPTPRSVRHTISREELYSLVWQTPLSRLAKRFGLSDVGLRKICVKHDIPTPPLGYWSKLAHGKPVCRPPLPSKDGTTEVHLVLHTGPAVPPAVAAAQADALHRESGYPSIIVPSEPPAKLHRVVKITAKALRVDKSDDEGFKRCKEPGGVDVTIGSHSIDRVLSMIHAFVYAAEERGYVIAEQEGGVRIIVDGVAFAWRLYEIKDRTAHQQWVPGSVLSNRSKWRGWLDVANTWLPVTYPTFHEN